MWFQVQVPRVLVALALGALIAGDFVQGQEPTNQASLSQLGAMADKIPFESFLDSNWEICLINANGSGRRNLTNTPDQHELYPQASPDSRICFLVDSIQNGDTLRSVYYMNADGSGRTRVAEKVREPCWIPDGTKIAFRRQEFAKFNVAQVAEMIGVRGKWDLSAMGSAARGQPVQLTHDASLPGNGSPGRRTWNYGRLLRSEYLRVSLCPAADRRGSAAAGRQLRNTAASRYEMLFHTWPFLLFFVVVYVVYLALRKSRYWLHWLLIASYFFYGWWNPLYLLLVVYSTLLDYLAVAVMDGSSRKRFWLAFSLINNLFLLGFFKYGGFVTENINQLLTQFHSGWTIPVPDVLLPVGISFYTFQSMSYTIDFYRGEIPRERSFIRFATFVSLFPQLVAGPIERASALLPQLTAFPRISRRDISDGLSLFLVGLFKKVALADYLAAYVDPIYATPERFGASSLLLATFAFAWQIYFDFSGYTDMARGVARVMGFQLMVNFYNPYLATSLGEFWSRWHISLSSWFRDYVYIPLGGNRRGTWMMYRNIFLTMVLSGIWHGAAWTFIVWGALHALATMATRSAERSAWYRRRVPTWTKQLLVFAMVCFAWIFFRAASISDAWLIVSRIATSGWDDPAMPILAILLVGAVWIYQYSFESRIRPWLELPTVRIALAVSIILYLCFAPGSGNAAFIYFQF